MNPLIKLGALKKFYTRALEVYVFTEMGEEFYHLYLTKTILMPLFRPIIDCALFIWCPQYKHHIDPLQIYFLIFAF